MRRRRCSACFRPGHDIRTCAMMDPARAVEVAFFELRRMALKALKGGAR